MQPGPRAQAAASTNRADLGIDEVSQDESDKPSKVGLGDLVLSVLPWPFHKDLPEAQMDGTLPPETASGKEDEEEGDEEPDDEVPGQRLFHRESTRGVE